MAVRIRPAIDHWPVSTPDLATIDPNAPEPVRIRAEGRVQATPFSLASLRNCSRSPARVAFAAPAHSLSNFDKGHDIHSACLEK